MSPVTPERSGTAEVVIGFDFGQRRIGIALGDTLTRSARPLSALVRRDGAALAQTDWQQLRTLAREHAAHRLVVGCPYNIDGSEHALAATVRRFAADLHTQTSLPVHLVDERYSSLEAEATLRERRAAGARRSRIDRETIDSTAAAIILERWLAGEHETSA